MKSRFDAPVWAAPLAVAALVAALGWWGNERMREIVCEDLQGDLAATLQANVMALEIWTTNQSKLATALAEEPAMRALAIQALLPGHPNGPGRDPKTARPAEELSAYLRARLERLGYEIAHVINTDFQVVATSIPGQARVGLAIADNHVAKFSELFASGQPVIITPFKPKRAVLGAKPRFTNQTQRAHAPGTSGQTEATPHAASPAPPVSETVMQVAVPLRDEQNNVRGALALVINPDAEFTRILSVARAGVSGETYVFDQQGVMLSRSRFESQLRELGLLDPRTEATSAAGLRLIDPGPIPAPGEHRLASHPRHGPLIHIVANAVAGGTGVDVEPSRDYRGVPVIGAWQWLPHHGFGVATQLDAVEGYAPLQVVNRVFAMVFLSMGLCTTAIFLVSYLGALWRRRLSQAQLQLQQLGQYTLEDKIGEGAMGVVYRARHALLRRETALKLLPPDRADAVSVKRFEREVRLSCQLTHPNTIQIFDYGRTPEGVFYCAMELLRGLNLHELVEKFGPQPEARVVYVLAQICDALAEAHALGLVHRDIKPANIFLCHRGGLADWVKVLDFGLVRAYHDGKGSRVRSLAQAAAEGTPLFMPPEAFADSGAADPRSDIYSLGALAYYLLTAQYVFEAGSDLELYQKHLSETPRRPSARTVQPVTAELEETVLRCLEKEPNLRPQSVLDLKELLLTTPLASRWRAEERLAWWARYQTAPGPPAAESAAATPHLNSTVRVSIPGA